MTVSFQGRSLEIDGKTIAMPWPILDVRDQGDRILVLLDPDSYLLDPDYKNARKQGATAIRNLVALTRAGVTIWEAEMPEPSDYYYCISSSVPLVANSFSSYRCELDPVSGAIRSTEFIR